MIQGVADDVADAEALVSAEAKELAFHVLLAMGGQIGEDFLSQLPRTLASEFGVHGAYVCEVAFDRERMYPIVASFDDESVQRPEYLGQGGVVDVLIERGAVAQAHSVVETYPDDAALAGLKAEALAGDERLGHVGGLLAGGDVGVLRRTRDAVAGQQAGGFHAGLLGQVGGLAQQAHRLLGRMEAHAVVRRDKVPSHLGAANQLTHALQFVIGGLLFHRLGDVEVRLG